MEKSTIIEAIKNAKDAADARDWLGHAVISMCDKRLIDPERAYEMLASYRAAYLETWRK